MKVDDLAQRGRARRHVARRPAGPSPSSSRPRSAPRCCSDIKVSIGRTGRATPFAVLEPVFVGGSTVGSATLHNEDQVRGQGRAPRRHRHRAQGRRRDPRGRRARCSACGPKGPQPWTFPTTCPCLLRSPLVRLEGESDTLLHRTSTARASATQRIVHFASRGAMDIEGLGERTVMLLSAERAGRRRADIYRLTAEQCSASRASARCRRRQPAGRHRGVEGPAAARPAGRRSASGTSGRRRPSVLARGFGNLDRIMGASEDELAAVDGVGPDRSPRRAHVVLRDDATGRWSSKLRAAGVDFGKVERAARAPDAGGHGRRGHRHARRAQPGGGRGGHQGPGRQGPGQRVARRRTAVVVGEGPGAAKLTKAEELGVPILDEAGFAELLETGELPYAGCT